MIEFFQSRARSFQYAFSGWGFVLRTQKNAWIHTAFSAAVVLVSFWLQLSRQDWALVIIAITLVWTSEFINTALETVVDLASRYEQDELAKIGKDVGAAAVLIAAGSSALIGILVLGPPLWQRLQALF
jgi:diacylglycerol kinase